MIDYDWVNGRGSGAIQQIGPPEAREPHPRPTGCPPPCASCPKKGPQHEREFRLSEKNWLTLDFYRQTKATFGRGLSEEEARDGIVRRNFAALDELFDGTNRERLSEALAVGVAGLLSRLS